MVSPGQARPALAWSNLGQDEAGGGMVRIDRFLDKSPRVWRGSIEAPFVTPKGR